MKQLTNKVAAVFAANGAIASEVAKALASEGATVYLSGRNTEALQALSTEIQQQGGHSEVHQVDATNEQAIDDFLSQIVEKEKQLDVVFNGIGLRATDLQYGTPSIKLPFEKFMKVLHVHVGSQFLTSRIAARHMMATQSQGTIITLTASLSRIKTPMMSGITTACTAIEGMTRSLSAEYGRAGIKVICLNPTALIDTRTIQETNALSAQAMGIPAEAMADQMKASYLLGKSPSTRDIGKLAAFLATDTGALLNSHIVDADFGTFNVI